MPVIEIHTDLLISNMLSLISGQSKLVVIHISELKIIT
jgi:hypothetical protein